MKDMGGGGGGGQIDPARINYLQNAQPYSHKVEIR